jgi:hypothetical protein
MKFSGVTFIVASFSLLLLVGCNKPEESSASKTGDAMAGAPPPTKINDAMSNPNVPDSVKAQMRSMQSNSGTGKP